MSGFEVVIEALHKNVRFLHQAEDSWAAALGKIDGKLLGPDDLGLLGKQNGVIQDCNDASAKLAEGLKRGVENLQKAADSLKAVAEDRVRREEEITAQLKKTQ
ncbi:hypothetical protein [Saccharopolyspora sp. ASAGF58]|uniref:hypothetical protein n=1 Tax=Saccharopolyspora sp. ASAGF58 TaxID=2719023 RepID=UPI00144012EF|nr:hypothetical protein [Saccharopolyspora sp. ASAGF58]QIZ35929.1 hypothetical protein FDZ84_16065 [Saccharopolyspora sp. ASAGF58]